MVKILVNDTKPEHKVIMYTGIALVALLAVYLMIIRPLVYKSPTLECEPCPECMDCETCPKVIEYQNITMIVTKFVCSNGSVVTKASECEFEEPEPEPVELPPLNPILTNEEGTLIKSVTVKPACVSGYKGGYINYEVVSPAANVTYQVKEEDGQYEDVLFSSGLFHSNRYFVICAPNCPRAGDFSLESGKRYLLRIKFDRTKVYDTIEYSNEHVLDLMPGSEYMTKIC